MSGRSAKAPQKGRSNCNHSNSNSNRRQELGKNKKSLEEEFDVVEEAPDVVTDSGSSSSSSSSDEGEAVLPKSNSHDGDANADNAGKLGIPGGDSDEKKRRLSAAMESHIESHKVSFQDFLNSLDFYMLGLFAKFMVGFFIFCCVIVLIYLAVVYNLDEDLWFEYFPVQDDDYYLEEEEDGDSLLWRGLQDKVKVEL